VCSQGKVYDGHTTHYNAGHLAILKVLHEQSSGELKNCSDQVSWRFGWKYDQYSAHNVFVLNDLVTCIFSPSQPNSISIKSLSRQSFWWSFWKIGLKMWSLECSQGFCVIWHRYLFIHPTWPRFNLNRNIINTIILTNFHDNWVKNVVSIVFKRFLCYLT
jgi:hypothetical protein